MRRRKITKRSSVAIVEDAGAQDERRVEIGKRIVERGGQFCVLSEKTNRSFGCYATRGEAELRLRQIERFKSEDVDSAVTSEVLVEKQADHVHVFNIGGARIVTVANKGDVHDHKLTLSNGTGATTTRDKAGPEHTHKIVIETKEYESGPPQPESKPSPQKKADDGVPAVLTWEAVRKGEMPTEGSGLPASLECDVPPAYRYWKCENARDARAVRDELVASGIFGTGFIREVDAVPRRVIVDVVEKVYLSPAYDDAEDVVVPPPRRLIERVAGELDLPEGAGDVVLFDEHVVEAMGIREIAAKATSLDRDWVIATMDSAEAREVLKSVGGAVRHLASTDLVFAASRGFLKDAPIEIVSTPNHEALIAKAFAPGRIIPLIKADEEERIVYGVVLEPDEVDAQNDTISPDEIRKAAHAFMENFGKLGLQHKEIINGKVVLLESFIAPLEFDVNGQAVKKGTWVMAERVRDDVLWKAIKTGKITGFSIGGSAVRKPKE